MPSTVTYTNSSGSGKVRVYPAGDVHSSRSPSVHSPTSSESRSSSQFSDWTHLSEDEIDPSESASRPPRPSRSRRHHTEARPAPSRHHSSRYEQDEPPRQHRSHRHRSSRHQSHESHDHRDRHDSRRHPSDGSSSGTVELHDEFYGRRGPPTQPPFPPSGAYRHGSGPIPSSHGGFPPGMPGPSAYADPFQPQALVHRSQHDPYGYPTQGNPFAPGPSAPNPFSPMESTHSSYFQTEPQQPPMSQPHRPGPPSQRHSMYGHGPSGSTAYGSELMVSPYGYPGMHGMPHMMQGYPMPAPSPYSGYPPSHVASPAPPQPKEEKKEEPKEVVKEVIVEKPDEATLKELGELRELIKKTEEERVAREQAAIAAAAAKKAKEEQEALQKKEVAAASAAAKEAAEKAAEEAAKAAKEESDKKLAEAEAARAELEKKQKELEEVVKKNEPEPDMLKAPIKFKDAVGRKFSFPWHLCKTWKGMEGLIKQAFLHVDVIGQHVQEGHYDLMGPDGEIILPQVWDTMIKPDWEVSMHMWPIPETPEKKKKKKEEPEEPPLVDEHGHPLGPDPYGPTLDQILAMNAQAAAGKDPAKKAKKKDKSAKRASAHIVDVPPAAAAAPPPAAFPPGLDQATYDALLAAQAQQGPMVVDVAPGPEAAPKVKQKKKLTGLQAWMVGAQPRPSKKDDEERDLSASNHSHSHSHHAATAPVTIARRRRSTAGSSWTTASASPPAKVVATTEQGTSCAVM